MEKGNRRQKEGRKWLGFVSTYWIFMKRGIYAHPALEKGGANYPGKDEFLTPSGQTNNRTHSILEHGGAGPCDRIPKRLLFWEKAGLAQLVEHHLDMVMHHFKKTKAVDGLWCQPTPRLSVPAVWPESPCRTSRSSGADIPAVRRGRPRP